MKPRMKAGPKSCTVLKAKENSGLTSQLDGTDLRASLRKTRAARPYLVSPVNVCRLFHAGLS